MSHDIDTIDALVVSRSDRDDATFAASLADALSERNYRVDLAIGSGLAERLDESAERCRCLVVVVGSAIDAADDADDARAIAAWVQSGRRAAALVRLMMTGLPREVSRAHCINFIAGPTAPEPLAALAALLDTHA